jgi:hypothetical protein
VKIVDSGAINGKCDNTHAKAPKNDHMAKPPSGVVGLRQSANRTQGGDLKEVTIEMEAQLSEKAKENLQRNEESRKKDSKYLKLQPGEKVTLHFDPEKIDQVELEFDGKKNKRYQYAVTDPNEPEQPEKYFTVSKRISAVIDTYLAEGKSILKIHGIGAGKDTQYVITPA